MTAIKICGLRETSDVALCARLGVEFVGFVAFSASPRHVEPEIYQTLSAALPPASATRTVLVTVDADDAWLDRYFSLRKPDFLQCHGEEPPERLFTLKARYDCGIIKALPVAECGDLDQTARYAKSADLLLLDAKPAATEIPGGNARAFDWNLLQDATLPLPWFLSGGLTAANAAAALALTRAPMVDTSSGVESRRGVKDPRLIEEFVRHVRHAAG